jgi:hypothetical protein
LDEGRSGHRDAGVVGPVGDDAVDVSRRRALGPCAVGRQKPIRFMRDVEVTLAAAEQQRCNTTD